MVDRLIGRIDRIPLWLAGAAAVALVLLIGSVDFFTGAQLSISVFYLLPIALVSWRTGRIWSYAFSGASATVWYVANLPGNLEMGFSQATLLWNALTRLGFFLIVAALVGSTRRLLDRERELAATDPVTGLLNHRAFFRVARIELDRARRYGHPVSMIYIDLDAFKQFNDQYGHMAGDSALQAVAQSIKGKVRTSDIVARLGGDEFGVVLPEAGLDAAEAVAAKLQRSVAESSAQVDPAIALGMCQGVVTFLQAPESVDQLVGMADQLMYAAKRSGRGGIASQVVRSGSEGLQSSPEVT
jgi:diguanylate cyclase (GGDEF)-like protein